MRSTGLMLLALLAAGCSCAGADRKPDDAIGEADAEAPDEQSSASEGTPETALGEEGEEAAAEEVAVEIAPFDPTTAPTFEGLPPAHDATWVAPEMRLLAVSLEQTAQPPSAIFYAGGTHAPGCQELYTFRFFFGDKHRYADVAGFERLSFAEGCQQIAAEHAESAPERIGVFLLDFSASLAADPALVEAVRTAVGNLTFGSATRIPRDATPYGALPGTVVRHRHPRPR